MSIVKHPDQSVTLCPERLMAVLQSAYELEAIAMHLPGLRAEDAQGSELYLLRGYAARIKELASVTMSAASDEMEDPAQLLERVTLQKAVKA
jgi:hypothetical protein